MDISTILPLLTGMNSGNSDMAGLMGMLGANQGGGDMSALLSAMGGMQGNNGMAGLMNMFGGMQNSGVVNASDAASDQNAANNAASVNNAGGGDNSQMMNMLPLLFNMMNGGAVGNNMAESDTAQTAQENAADTTEDESDINYRLYKLLQEQARKGM